MNKDAYKLYRVNVNYFTYILAHKDDPEEVIIDLAYEKSGEDMLVSDSDIFDIFEIEDLSQVPFDWQNEPPWVTDPIDNEKSSPVRHLTIKEILDFVSSDDGDTGIPDNSYIYLNGKKYRLTLVDDYS